VQHWLHVVGRGQRQAALHGTRGEVAQVHVGVGDEAAEPPQVGDALSIVRCQQAVRGEAASARARQARAPVCRRHHASKSASASGLL